MGNENCGKTSIIKILLTFVLIFRLLDFKTCNNILNIYFILYHLFITIEVLFYLNRISQ